MDKILDKAAAYLEFYGWQGFLPEEEVKLKLPVIPGIRDKETAETMEYAQELARLHGVHGKPRTVWGAILSASVPVVTAKDFPSLGHLDAVKAQQFFEKCVGTCIHAWNNIDGRTQQEAIKALRAAAERHREQRNENVIDSTPVAELAELREARATLEKGWKRAVHEFAATGERFSSVEIWERVRRPDATRVERRLFFRRIHRVLAPLVDAGLLQTELEPPPRYGVAKRFYWKPK
jgi:hypothetical protein